MFEAPMRRLRALQILRLSYPEQVNSDLVLRMLQEDDEMITEVQTIRALVWLEDQGLCETKIHDYQGMEILFSRISDRGLAFLNQPRGKLSGIMHPSEVF